MFFSDVGDCTQDLAHARQAYTTELYPKRSVLFSLDFVHVCLLV